MVSKTGTKKSPSTYDLFIGCGPAFESLTTGARLAILRNYYHNLVKKRQYWKYRLASSPYNKEVRTSATTDQEDQLLWFEM